MLQSGKNLTSTDKLDAKDKAGTPQAQEQEQILTGARQPLAFQTKEVSPGVISVVGTNQTEGAKRAGTVAADVMVDEDTKTVQIASVVTDKALYTKDKAEARSQMGDLVRNVRQTYQGYTIDWEAKGRTASSVKAEIERQSPGFFTADYKRTITADRLRAQIQTAFKPGSRVESDIIMDIIANREARAAASSGRAIDLGSYVAGTFDSTGISRTIEDLPEDRHSVIRDILAKNGNATGMTYFVDQRDGSLVFDVQKAKVMREHVRAAVLLLPKSDAGTVLHELTHVIEVMDDLSVGEKSALEQHFGKPYDTLTVEDRDEIAYGALKFLRTGTVEGPSGLRGVYEKLSSLFQSVVKRAREAKVKLSPALSDFYAQVFLGSESGKAIIAAQTKTVEALNTEIQAYALPEESQAPLFEKDEALPERSNQNYWIYKAEETVSAKMKGHMPGRTVLAMLKGAGVKAEELEWTGLDTYLDTDEKLTPAQVKEHIEGNKLEIKEVVKTGVPEGSEYDALWNEQKDLSARIVAEQDPKKKKQLKAEFARVSEKVDAYRSVIPGYDKENLKLPGGQNYRERLFTLPVKINDGKPSGENYSSSHWDERNVLAHTRLDDMTTPDGKKMLFVEEIQSDWHQKGRRAGYEGDKPAITELPPDFEVRVKNNDDTPRYAVFAPNGMQYTAWSFSRQSAINAAINSQNDVARATTESPVPDAPFKKTWHEFAFKKILREAVDNGYDSVGWTTGDQQAERYDLSKQINSIGYIKKAENAYRLFVRGKQGEIIYSNDSASSVTPDEMEDIIGKEMTKKVVDGIGTQEGTTTYLRNLDLKVGGEGMKGFYDKMLVDYANKLGKKYGTRVEDVVLPGGETVHSMAITDALRDDLGKKGQYLFEKSDPIDSHEFKAWFKDSQVVDEDGKPLVMYHATRAEVASDGVKDQTFDAFNTESVGELGAHFGNPEQAAGAIGGEDAYPESGVPHRMYPVYLSIQHPLRLEDMGGFSAKNVLPQLRDLGVISRKKYLELEKLKSEAMYYEEESRKIEKEMQDAIISAGYDGVVYLNRREGADFFGPDGVDGDDLDSMTDDEVLNHFPDAADSWISFSPSQVKSVFNQGAWDPDDSRILFEKEDLDLVAPPGSLPDDSAFALFEIKDVQHVVTVRSNAPKTIRIYEVSSYPEEVKKIIGPDHPAEIEIQTLEQATRLNTNTERITDWQHIYRRAMAIDDDPSRKIGFSDMRKVNKDGKLETVPVIALSKGCQRAQTMVERVLNGLMPNETNVEACYGGTCWVNRQFNAVFGTFENMEVRDLVMARPEDIDRWFKSKTIANFLGAGPFIREGQMGCSSHAFPILDGYGKSLAEVWLENIRNAGINNKTVWITAAYAPVSDESYKQLLPYKDLMEIHVSVSGWFHRNELMIRLAEFQRIKDMGLPVVMRLITNKDNITGLVMPNHNWLMDIFKEMGVDQAEVLETPYHDDMIRKGQDRSEATGDFRFICCETGKCNSCGSSCMTKIRTPSSVATSWERISVNGSSPAVSTGEAVVATAPIPEPPTTTHDNSTSTEPILQELLLETRDKETDFRTSQDIRSRDLSGEIFFETGEPDLEYTTEEIDTVYGSTTEYEVAMSDIENAATIIYPEGNYQTSEPSQAGDARGMLDGRRAWIGAPVSEELGPAGKNWIPEAVRAKRSRRTRIGLTGLVLPTKESFAAAFQVYRNAHIEAFHLIYLNKDGKVLAHNAMSSGNPASSRAIEKVGFLKRYLDSRISRISANIGEVASVWLMHNHPSGRTAPSGADENMTWAYIDALGPLFGSHIIIDHGTATEMKLKRSAYGASTLENTEFSYLANQDQHPSVDPSFVSQVHGPNDAARLFHGTINASSKTALIILNNRHQVIAWEPIKNVVLNTIYRRVAAYAGSSGMIVTEDDDIYHSAVYDVRKSSILGKGMDNVVFDVYLFRSGQVVMDALADGSLRMDERTHWDYKAARARKNGGHAGFLFEEKSDLASEASSFDSYAEFRETYLLEDEDESTIKTAWADSRENSGRIVSAATADTRFIEKLKGIPEEFQAFMDALGASLYDQGKDRKGITIVEAAAVKTARGGTLSNAEKNRVMRFIEGSPRRYREQYARISGDSAMLAQIEAEATNQVPEEFEIEPPAQVAHNLASLSVKHLQALKGLDPDMQKAYEETKMSYGEATSTDSSIREGIAELEKTLADTTAKYADYRNTFSYAEKKIVLKQRELAALEEQLKAERVKQRFAKTMKQAFNTDTLTELTTQRDELETLIRGRIKKLAPGTAMRSADYLATKKAIKETRTKIEERYRIARAKEAERALMRSLGKAILRPVSHNTDFKIAQQIRTIQKTFDGKFRREIPGWSIEALNAAFKEAPDIRKLLPPEVVARLEKRPLNDWTLEDLRDLHRRVEALREEGRAIYEAKRARLKAERVNAQAVMIQALESSGMYVDQPPYGTDEFNEQMKKDTSILRQWDRSLQQSHRIARTLDNGREGQFYTSLIVAERSAYTTEKDSFDRRWSAIEAKMKELGVKADDLYGQRVALGKNHISKWDAMGLYIGLQNRRTREAIIYGNMMNQDQRAKLEDNQLLSLAAQNLGDAQDAAQTLTVPERELAAFFIQDGDVNFDRIAEATYEYENRMPEREGVYFPHERRMSTGEGDKPEEIIDQVLNGVEKAERGVGKSPTINRIEIGKRHQSPIVLDAFGVYRRGMERQEHYIGYAGFISKANLLIKNKYTSGNLRYMVKQTHGQGYLDYLDRWISEAANPKAFKDFNKPASGIERTLKTLRGPLGIAYLGLRASSAFKQLVTSPIPFLPYAKETMLSRMIQNLNPPEFMKALAFARANSAFIRHRVALPTEAWIKAMGEAGAVEKGLKTAAQMTMKLIEWADTWSVATGWMAVYEHQRGVLKDAGLSESEIHAQSVAEADKIVQETQPTSRPQDLAPLFKMDSEAMKMLTQFQTPLNVVYNQLFHDVPDAFKTGHAGRGLGIIAGYFWTGAILALLRAPRKDDDDDDETKTLKDILSGMISQPLEAIPFAGGMAANAASRFITGERAYRPSDPFPGFSRALNGIEKVISSQDAEDAKTGFLSFLEGTGMLAGFPTSAVKEYGRVIFDGDLGALIGRPKE